MAPAEPPSTKQRHALIPHIAFEYAAQLKCAQTFRTARGRDALEAFLLHARLLREFLWKCWDPDSPHAASEVLAEHYFDDQADWRGVRGGLTATLAETKDAMDRHDVPYNCLAEENGIRLSLYHTALSREELVDYEDALKALALAHRAIALVCVGINGDAQVDVSDGGESYSYFTVPTGHTFLWRLLFRRDEAVAFMRERDADDADAVGWAETLPLQSNEELVGYH